MVIAKFAYSRCIARVLIDDMLGSGVEKTPVVMEGKKKDEFN